VTVRFTSRGCKVETTCIIQPNGSWRERIELSVDPASTLAIAIEERAGRDVRSSATVAKIRPRHRR
jgi:hypothetical protein